MSRNVVSDTNDCTSNTKSQTARQTFKLVESSRARDSRKVSWQVSRIPTIDTSGHLNCWVFEGEGTLNEQRQLIIYPNIPKRKLCINWKGNGYHKE